ncbi:MAG TPA: DUF4317 domain-containing protein [Candidatus Faecousia intestinigallinarum]|nr:DUF4317 domain-containing protein [Candidatus Faecousia intestinigallinarum]
MNTKEVGEIRRHLRRDRSNMTAIYGCYVNDNRQIVAQFRQSTGIMPENEAEKYFGLLRRSLSGSLGKNLHDLTFKTSQVTEGKEHKLLMELRATQLKDDALRQQFYEKIAESLNMQESYLILLGCDTYDVPFKSRDEDMQPDASGESYTYLICAVCPVKQQKQNLCYVPESKDFHDSGIRSVAGAPELGFLFPAFDNRATNIYNALYYTHSPKENHEDFVRAVFQTAVAMPAAEQKKAFESLLSASLEEQCSMEVVQAVHTELCQQIAMHKESKIPEPLLIHKEQVQQVLAACGVGEEKRSKFGVQFDEVFGYEAELHPKNIIDEKRVQIHTPDASIQIDPARADAVETRIIGGVKYILVRAEEDVEVNGVSVHIGES